MQNLKQIIPGEWDGSRIKWLWDQLATQSYAFDDTTEGNPQYFVSSLFDDRTAVFELADSGLVLVKDIVPKINAQVHFTLWDKDYDRNVLKNDAKELFSFLFDEYELNRITAPVPRNNQPAARFILSLGFRYEGALREAYLRGGVYHDFDIYGLLRKEKKCLQQ